MADLHKFTTKEVLNKVLLDSSGNAVAAYSHTTQEALNAVLDTANSRLNVSIVGGTISGDVTISGDLTVEGNGSGTYDEIIQGNLALKEQASASARLLYHDTDDALLWTVGVARTTNDIKTGSANLDLVFSSGYASNIIFANTSESMRITSTGSVQITQTAVSADSGTNAHIKLNGAQAYNHASNFVTITGNTIYHSNGSSARHTILRAGKENTTDNNYAMFTAFYSRAHGSHAAERMRITSEGHLVPGADNTYDIGTTNAQDWRTLFIRKIDMQNELLTIEGASTAATYKDHSSVGNGHIFYHRNSEAMRIGVSGSADLATTFSGDVSINSSGGSLVVKNTGTGTDADADITLIAGAGGVNADFWKIKSDHSDNQLYFINGNDTRALITSEGNVGIGITPKEVSGNTTLTVKNIYVGSTGALHGSINSDDAIYINFDANNSNTNSGFYVTTNGVGTTGTKIFAIEENSRISLSNTDAGTSNTIFGKNAGVNLVSNSAYNIAIGELALNAYKGDDGNNSGTKNIAIGISAMEAFQGGDGDVHANTRFDRNIALGYNSFRGTDFNNAEVVVTDNIAIGDEALNSTGANGQVGTIAIGSNALTALTVGAGNTAIGYQAGMALGDCNNNTILGYQAFKSANGGEHNNVVIGQGAGLSCDNASVDNNVIIGNGTATGGAGSMVNCIYIGAEAGTATHPRNQNDNIFIGKGVAKTAWGGQCDDNIGIGSGAMSTGALNDAHGNVAMGYEAMKTLTQSDNNVAIGKQALSSILAGSGGNVAIGYLSGRDTTGAYNILIGQSAGMQQTSGSGSVNIGHEAGKVDASSANVIIGHLAFSASNTSNSSSNVIVGYESGVEINHADSTDNVIIGRGAGRGGAGEFTNNIAIGSYALDGTGTNDVDGSVAIGHYALTAVTSGDYNTAIGYQAGNVLTTGSDNTIIGYDADVDANSRAGCIVIGKGLSLNTASDNVVEIGNNTNSMTYDLDGGDITVTSDVRTKKNIKDTKLGLNFINKLRPVTYQTKATSQYPKEFKVKNPSKKSSGKTWDGLIAQEVKEVMDEMTVGFSGWEEGINTKQRLAYGKFVMPLIKAVQELSSKVEELEAKLSK